MTRIGVLFSVLFCVGCAGVKPAQDHELMLWTSVAGSDILPMAHRRATSEGWKNYLETLISRNPENVTLTNDIQSLNPIRFEISSVLNRLSEGEYNFSFTCTLDYMKSVVINQSSAATSGSQVSGDIEKSHRISKDIKLKIDQPHSVLLPGGLELTVLIEPRSRYVWEQVKTR